MQSPPFPRYLVPPRSKYSPQHLVLKHPQLPFLPQCQLSVLTLECFNSRSFFKDRQNWKLLSKSFVLSVGPEETGSLSSTEWRDPEGIIRLQLLDQWSIESKHSWRGAIRMYQPVQTLTPSELFATEISYVVSRWDRRLSRLAIICTSTGFVH